MKVIRIHTLCTLTAVLCGTLAFTAPARRAAPPPAATVTHDSVRYAATYDRQDGSFAAAVEAREVQGDRPLWKAPMYRIAYLPGSRDTQERYVKRLLREEAGLVALREDGKFFFLPAAALSGQAPRQAVELPEPQVPVDEARLDRGPLILVSTSTGQACPVHRSPLREDVVRIVYGLPLRPNPDFVKAEQERFPNARVSWPAGCIVGSHRWAKVRYCPDCRRERGAYLRSIRPPES